MLLAPKVFHSFENQPNRPVVSFASPKETLKDTNGAELVHGEPPKPPRSAFMCFTDHRKQEVVAQNGPSQASESAMPYVAFFILVLLEFVSDLICLLPLSYIQTKKDLLKLVASEWRQLSDKARAFWEEESRKDKVRYVLVRPVQKLSTDACTSKTLFCLYL